MNRVADETNMLRAAFLRGNYHMDQQSIADSLSATTGQNVDQPRVAKWLKEATKRGYLTKRTGEHFNDSRVQPDRYREISKVKAWSDLVDALRRSATTEVKVRSVVILPGDDAARIEVRLDRFGTQAASALRQILSRSGSVGVTWGHTLSAVVEALDTLDLSRPIEPIRFYPVCPDDLTGGNSRTASSMIAERFHEIVNVGHPHALHPPSLNGVPPFIPKSFQGDVKFSTFIVDEFESYGEIFGRARLPGRAGQPAKGREPAIDTMHTLLTSVGSRGRLLGGTSGGFLSKLIKHGGISAEKLSELVVGDIGGVLMPRPSISVRDRRRIESLNDSVWNGLQRRHLEGIAARAHQSGSIPGVVVFSVAEPRDAEVKAGRAATIVEGARQGLINELIIDEVLAGQMRPLLGLDPVPDGGIRRPGR